MEIISERLIAVGTTTLKHPEETSANHLLSSILLGRSEILKRTGFPPTTLEVTGALAIKIIEENTKMGNIIGHFQIIKYNHFLDNEMRLIYKPGNMVMKEKWNEIRDEIAWSRHVITEKTNTINSTYENGEMIEINLVISKEVPPPLIYIIKIDSGKDWRKHALKDFKL